MKLFITWSGESSRRIGTALRDLVPKILQAVEPFMSEHDIEGGAQWQPKLANELESSDAGIICVTPDNRNAPWLLFEAGALSKKRTEKSEARVYTYLHKLVAADVTYPLAMFQHTLADKEGTRKLLQSLRRLSTAKNPSEQALNELFDSTWPGMEESLKVVPASSRQVKRSEQEKMDELLELTRGIAQQVVSLQTISVNGVLQSSPYRSPHEGLLSWGLSNYGNALARMYPSASLTSLGYQQAPTEDDSEEEQEP